MTLGAATGLVCAGCGATFELGPEWWGCPDCRDEAGRSHWLDVTYDYEHADRDALAAYGRVWSYETLLPGGAADAPSLGEGGTPLLRLERLSAELGLADLHLKLETVNPTTSFKDRFQTVSMSVARSLGYTRATIVTTGNAGVAAAAMAAAAGLALVVVTDPAAPEENVRQMRLFGAHVVMPTGTGPVIHQALELVTTLVRDHGFYPSSVQGTHAGPATPYGVEGYKTIAYEVAAQLGRAPDRFCTPVSGGDALYGPYRGFRELHDLGLIDSLPAMTGCQATGAASLAESLRRGLDHVVTVEPSTLALSIGDPTGSASALRAVRATDGTVLVASDELIIDTLALLGRHGLSVEAASAAAIAGLRQGVADGTVDPDEQIVAVLTGSGLRWPAQIDVALRRASVAGSGEPSSLPADPDLIIRHLEDSP